MRVLITGGSGFVGGFLVSSFLQEGSDLHLLSRQLGERFVQKRKRSKIRVHQADLLDPHRVRRVVKKVLPDAVVHLAAFSLVSDSWDDPIPIMQANLMGSLYLLEAVRKECPSARVLLIGSSDIYGKVNLKKQPIKETEPLKPISPYGVSKAALDLLAFQYGLSYNLHIVRTRSFNHTGPGQSLDYVVPSFAWQAVQVARGKSERAIRTGNLKIERDFSDVRDVVRAYALLIRRGKKGEAYNVCSGRKIQLKTILQMMVRFSGVEVRFLKDPDRLRPADITTLWGSPRKLKSHTGWKPRISFEQMCKDIYDYWSRQKR